MLDRLPESRPRRERRPLGTAVSVAAHVALVNLAVTATARINDAATPPVESSTPVFVPPQPPAPPAPIHRADGGAHGDGTTLPHSAPGRTVIAPIDVPITIPPIDPGAPGTADPIDFRSRTMATDAGTGSSGPAGDAPWNAHQVEKAVVALEGAPPRYPEMLRAAGVDGVVVARFVVDTLGRVEPGSVRILRATHPLFAQSVTAALPALRFLPAEAGGHRVRQLVEEPFSFTLRR